MLAFRQLPRPHGPLSLRSCPTSSLCTAGLEERQRRDDRCCAVFGRADPTNTTRCTIVVRAPLTALAHILSPACAQPERLASSTSPARAQSTATCSELSPAKVRATNSVRIAGTVPALGHSQPLVVRPSSTARKQEALAAELFCELAPSAVVYVPHRLRLSILNRYQKSAISAPRAESRQDAAGEQVEARAGVQRCTRSEYIAGDGRCGRALSSRRMRQHDRRGEERSRLRCRRLCGSPLCCLRRSRRGSCGRRAAPDGNPDAERERNACRHRLRRRRSRIVLDVSTTDYDPAMAG
jgi:hypothetical protein